MLAEHTGLARCCPERSASRVRRDRCNAIRISARHGRLGADGSGNAREGVLLPCARKTKVEAVEIMPEQGALTKASLYP